MEGETLRIHYRYVHDCFTLGIGRLIKSIVTEHRYKIPQNSIHLC